MRSKGKAYATTLSDSDSSTVDSEDNCDEKGNFSAFMTIAHVESSEDLNLFVQELGEHSDEEFMGIVEESDAEKDEDTVGLQENYNSFLEKSGKYARVDKAAMKKMKKAEEDYRSLLMMYKEAKCEIEMLNGELTEAYTKVKFLEHEVVQANAKVERVSTKKLNDVLSSQKTFPNKTGLRYTGESSSTVNISKEVKLVKAKEPVVVAPIVEKTKGEKKKKVEEDYRSLLVRYKEAKCEIETLNGELTEAYTKVRFLKHEVIQANAKVERVSTKKLDDFLSSQKTFSDKTRL